MQNQLMRAISTARTNLKSLGVGTFQKEMYSVLRMTEKLTISLSLVFLLVSLLLPAIAPAAPAPVAQDTEADSDPHPLRLADTSSPRDTLRSFLTNATAAIESRRRGESGMTVVRPYIRAMGTLDFSTTPDSDSWGVRGERVSLLKELLDRIELPPESEIPGKAEVADGTLTQWTIPDTSITIEKIERGPQTGQFLLSADTVQRLKRLYRNAKHLPYKPGATVGWYEAWRHSEKTTHAFEKRVRNRLKPVDTSNPRATLEGFLDSLNRAHALVREADAALKATPPTMTNAEALEIEITAGNLLRRGTATLDLSQVPKALREDVGVESALQLKEIIDRMLLPPLDSVPNAQMVAAAREQQSASPARTAGPVRWRFPNTEIEIAEVMEGERQGQFLFSAGTVSRIGEFYQRIRDLPYRQHILDGVNHDYLSPGKSEGFYEAYISTPGYLVPHRHFLGRFADELPDWLKTVHGGQTVWQWIALALSVLAAALASYGIVRFIKRLAGRVRDPLDEWLWMLAPIIVAIMVLAVVDFVDNDLNITGGVLPPPRQVAS